MTQNIAKWQKLVPWSMALASVLTALTVAGCGRGSDDKQDSGTEGQGSSDPSKSNQPSGQSSVNAVRISGQLNIGALELTGAEKGVFAFTARSGNIGGEPRPVTVGPDGTFSTELMKVEDSVQAISAELDKPRDQRDWEAMVRGAKSLLPNSEGLSVDQLRSMSDAELKSGIADLVNEMKKSGPVTVLVAYDKTGNRVTEAQSFRFISLPTPGGKSLSALPNERLKGNVDLGKISGSKRDVTSEAKSTDAFDLSASALDTMADAGRALKNLTNSYMNSGWKSQTFYFWQTTDKYTDVLDKFSTPANSSYKGYGFYIGSLDDQGLTYDDLCGNKSITFTPPSPITVDGSNTPLAQYSNAGASKGTQGTSRICTGNGYYAREDNYGKISYMLNFGTGGSIKSSPKGLWSLKVGSQEVGRFDFDMTSPIVDGKPTALIPRAKFITSGGKVTGVEVELHRWTGSQFEKVEDLGGFRRLVSEMSASITRPSDNKEFMTKLKVGEDNRIIGVFDSSDTEKQGEARNPPVPTSDIGSLAVYYVIANASYRIEFRN